MNIATMFCHRSVINASFPRSVQQRQAYFKERVGSDVIIAYQDDKSMTKREGKVHVLVMLVATNFVQNSIIIKKGESITLINDDLFGSHTIANGTWENGTAQPAREAGAPEARDANIGGNSSAAIGPFTTAGTFKLYCTVHTGMNLTVIVQ